MALLIDEEWVPVSLVSSEGLPTQADHVCAVDWIPGMESGSSRAYTTHEPSGGGPALRRDRDTQAADALVSLSAQDQQLAHEQRCVTLA